MGIADAKKPSAAEARGAPGKKEAVRSGRSS